MNLLHEGLPTLSLQPRIEPSDFFDRCASVAHEKGYGIDRRKEYAGKGYDQLNIYVGGKPDILPMIRMVSTPYPYGRLRLDVVDESIQLVYDEYVPNALSICRNFLRDYSRRYGKRIRIGIPKRRPHFEPSKTALRNIPYAKQKFEHAIRSMAIGKGDVRERLRYAFLSIHMIKPNELPEPLESELRWIYHELTKRPPRWKGEGTITATTAVMRRSKGAEIAERILAIYDALVEIEMRYLKKT